MRYVLYTLLLVGLASNAGAEECKGECAQQSPALDWRWPTTDTPNVYSFQITSKVDRITRQKTLAVIDHLYARMPKWLHTTEPFDISVKYDEDEEVYAKVKWHDRNRATITFNYSTVLTLSIADAASSLLHEMAHIKSYQKHNGTWPGICIDIQSEMWATQIEIDAAKALGASSEMQWQNVYMLDDYQVEYGRECLLE